MTVARAADGLVLTLTDEAIVIPQVGLDRNFVASLVADSGTEKGLACICLPDAYALGLAHEAKLLGVQRNARYDVHRALATPLLLSSALDEFAAAGIRVGLVNVSRSLLADRQAYFAIRDTIRGLTRNGALALVVDLLPRPDRRSHSSLLGHVHTSSMIAGMVGARKVQVLVSRPMGQSRPEAMDLDKFSDDVRSGQRPLGFLSPQEFEQVSGAVRIACHAASTFEFGNVQRRPDGSVSIEQMGTIRPSSAERRMTGIQRWLVGGAVPSGSIVVSEYAATRLVDEARGSLLAAGVVRASGRFEKDSVVSVTNDAGQLLGFGVSRYGDGDVEQLKGAEDVVVIHADYFYGLGLEDLVGPPPSEE